MTYKMKSLLYFGCFLAASFTYYTMETLDQPTHATEMIGLNDQDNEELPAEELIAEEPLKY